MMHNTCSMAICDLPDVYAQGPQARGLWAYISGKSPMAMLQLLHVTLSHLRSKEFTGIHKPCIPGLFSLPRVHLKVDQRVQRNNFPRIHLNVHRCTSGCIPGKLFL